LTTLLAAALTGVLRLLAGLLVLSALLLVALPALLVLLAALVLAALVLVHDCTPWIASRPGNNVTARQRSA
jgi:hypothetical protein